MLHTTHIGNLAKENATWLHDQGLFTRTENDEIGIRDNLIYNALLPRPVQLYSLFRWVVEDIQQRTGLDDINDIVTTMRTGYVPGRDFEMERIFSIAERGISNWEEASQTKGKSKHRAKEF